MHVCACGRVCMRVIVRMSLGVVERHGAGRRTRRGACRRGRQRDVCVEGAADTHVALRADTHMALGAADLCGQRSSNAFHAPAPSRQSTSGMPSRLAAVGRAASRSLTIAIGYLQRPRSARYMARMTHGQSASQSDGTPCAVCALRGAVAEWPAGVCGSCVGFDRGSGTVGASTRAHAHAAAGIARLCASATATQHRRTGTQAPRRSNAPLLEPVDELAAAGSGLLGRCGVVLRQPRDLGGRLQHCCVVVCCGWVGVRDTCVQRRRRASAARAATRVARISRARSRWVARRCWLLSVLLRAVERGRLMLATCWRAATPTALLGLRRLVEHVACVCAFSTTCLQSPACGC
jgi:hypothetical protein